MDINAAARAARRARAGGSLAESVLGAAAEFFFSSGARTPRGSAPAAADHARQEWGPVDFFAPGVLPVVATPTPRGCDAGGSDSPLPEDRGGLSSDLPWELVRAGQLQVQERRMAAEKISLLLGYRQRQSLQAQVVYADHRQRKIQLQEGDRAVIREIAQVLGHGEQATTAVLHAAGFAQHQLPKVWQAFMAGELDLVRVRKIVTAAAVLSESDAPGGAAALSQFDDVAARCSAQKNLGQLRGWLNRVVAALSPGAFEQQCAQARESRCVRFFHRDDGMSEVWALLPTVAAAAIQKRLHQAARTPHQAARTPHQPDQQNPSGQTNPGQQNPSGQPNRSEQTCPPRNAANGDAPAHDTNTSTGTGTGDGVDGSGSDATPSTAAELAALLASAVGFGVPEGDTSEGADSPAASSGHELADERTVAQREADILASWLTGGAGSGPEAGISASIAVMLPWETLVGVSDEPGVSCDRQWAVPADQARALVADTGAGRRWYSLYYGPPPGRARGSAGPDRPAGSDGSDGPRDGPSGPDGPRESAGSGDWTADPLVPGDLLAAVYEGHDPPLALREVLAFRDGTCQEPGCSVAAERCDLDHHVPWPAGETRASNLQHLCRRHHRQKSHGHLSPPTPKTPPMS
ncbi:HNH endonuclease [Nesterenkonia massiliensis]|uniref:HNH endonuclease n=1 Tax=Nesterenkonia massiliensis TaxID=1232429 RepID=A0ABT2HNC1_9MICC|nr:HNH endonuclease signature motif containing protein [Nesterenkonia massiliensis]MCT1606176.1 HNH endonuclease [Nesterenkonia massiliensis]